MIRPILILILIASTSVAVADPLPIPTKVDPARTDTWPRDPFACRRMAHQMQSRNRRAATARSVGSRPATRASAAEATIMADMENFRRNAFYYVLEDRLRVLNDKLATTNGVAHELNRVRDEMDRC